MQVAKYPIIGLNQDDDDVNLKPGWFREIWNALPKNGYSKSGIQNVKGTVVRTNGSLAAGTNTCIGAFADKPNNRVFYFLHNSNDDHSIWYYSPITATHTLVMQTEFFLFSLSFPIVSCDFMEGLMEWVDNNNEDRSLIVDRAVAGLYNFTNQKSFEKQVSLYKMPPRFPPTMPFYDIGDGARYYRAIGTAGFNNITGDSFQFCVQYVYYDNSISLISPLSVVNPADAFQSSSKVRNKIEVSHTVDTDIYSIIKKIYWIYVKNDDGEFQLFREIDLDTVDPTRISPSHTIDFYANETTSIIFPNQVNFIPNKSKAMVVHNQRSVVTMNQFDYEGSEVEITLSTVNADGVGFFGPAITDTSGQIKICLPNSSYTVGVQYFDRFGRTPGITASKTITIPNIKKSVVFSGVNIFPVVFGDLLNINFSLAGTPPSWADSYAVTLKPNNTFETAYLCLAFPMFYKRELGSSSVASNEVVDNGKVFADAPQNSWNKNIYWKIPKLPFSLDPSFKMRLMVTFLNGVVATKEVEDIISVLGDTIVTGNFGITNWSTGMSPSPGSFTPGMITVMFENVKEEPDEVFLEIGHHYNCSGGVLTTTSGIIKGDYYLMRGSQTFEVTDSGDFIYGGGYGDRLENGNANAGIPITNAVISQSPTHAMQAIDDVRTTVERQKKKRKRKRVLGLISGISKAVATVAPVIPGVGTAIAVGAAGVGAIADAQGARIDDSDKVTEIATLALVYSPDYNKIASDSGRPWIDVKNKKVSNEPNTLSFSDPYIINSKVNGLFNYTTIYQIPISRTPITKMVSIGASHILLLIHERSTTSITTYNGKVLNTSDGSQIIGDGNDVVGYDNELAGGYGTIYPDSVVHSNGRVWYFDPFSGEVVRYANGLQPIGSIYKMHNFFREKGNQFIDPTGRNVIGGYDSNLDILYLTFKSTTPAEEITVAFIDRQGEERWICFTDFLPERYAYINEKLYGFVNGVMWEFNANNTRNLFFGAQQTTRLRHLFNPEISREKMLLNIGVESNKKWAFNPITVPKFGVDQETSLAKSNFIRRDDVFYADVKRDKNTATGLLPAGKTALVAGQPMIGKVYDITLENDDTELVELDFINYGFIPSPGHNIV